MPASGGMSLLCIAICNFTKNTFESVPEKRVTFKGQHWVRIEGRRPSPIFSPYIGPQPHAHLWLNAFSELLCNNINGDHMEYGWMPSTVTALLFFYILGLQQDSKTCQSILPYLPPFWRVVPGHLMTSKSWRGSIFLGSLGKWKRQVIYNNSSRIPVYKEKNW